MCVTMDMEFDQLMGIDYVQVCSLIQSNMKDISQLEFDCTRDCEYGEFEGSKVY